MATHEQLNEYDSKLKNAVNEIFSIIDADDWEERKSNEEGLQIYLRHDPSSSFNQVKSICVISAPLITVDTNLRQPITTIDENTPIDKRNGYIEKCMIYSIGDGSDCAGFLYTVIEFPSKFISPREFLTYQKVINRDGKIVLVRTSIDNDELHGVGEGYVRGRLHFQAYIAESIKENKTKLTFIEFADPCGNIPSLLYNTFLINRSFSNVCSIKKEIEGARFELYLSYNSIIISQNKRTICAIDRFKLQIINAQPSEDQIKIPFHFILGLYKYEIRKGEPIYYLVLVTDYQKFDFFNVCKVTSFKIITLKETTKTYESEKFYELLKLGLNQCSMYFSDNYNLTLTLQQQFENQPSRECFKWNLEAIKCLEEVKCFKDVINVKCYKEVIGGYFNKENQIVIISRKSNKNGGCHTWNRGADKDGHAANFVENEEIILYGNDKLNHDLNINNNKINAISHIEIGGSCPIFWSQYPTMQLSRPFHFGPHNECQRRFKCHFKSLYDIYCQRNEQSIVKKESMRRIQNNNFDDNNGCSVIIVSLLNNKGKEDKLNKKYQEFAKEEGIEFHSINFSELMKEKGKLPSEIEKLNDELHFDATIIEDGIICEKQTKIPRVNCSSCLDRTSVFMEILFKYVFEKHLSQNKVLIHKKLWLDRADALSKEYALTKGQKTYMFETECLTLTGKYHDYAIQVQRFFYSIFYEGLYSDAYNAVLQERPFTKFEPTEIFHKIVLFFQLILIFIYIFLFEGRGFAVHTWRDRIKKIINHPHIPDENGNIDLRDADEYDNIDFTQKKENLQ